MCFYTMRRTLQTERTLYTPFQLSSFFDSFVGDRFDIKQADDENHV